jgi:hypothetical protein
MARLSCAVYAAVLYWDVRPETGSDRRQTCFGSQLLRSRLSFSDSFPQ